MMANIAIVNMAEYANVVVKVKVKVMTGKDEWKEETYVLNSGEIMAFNLHDVCEITSEKLDDKFLYHVNHNGKPTYPTSVQPIWISGSPINTKPGYDYSTT